VYAVPRPSASTTPGSSTVQLGPGRVRRQLDDAVCIIPIEVPHRGRSFLRLTDDDPRTVKVGAMTVMPAHDGAIEGPTDLEQRV
jgi:hypothetical protein